MYNRMILISIIAILAFGPDVFSQTNTLSLSEGEKSPPAKIDAIKWLAGYWRGEAFGGIAEEIWTPPLAGTMMCAFKLVAHGKVTFYEIVTITEEDGTLMLRLKHFHGDLKGWEEKNETVDFPLVKLEKDKVCFDGFTIQYLDDNHINMYVMVSSDPAAPEEIKFAYERVKN